MRSDELKNHSQLNIAANEQADVSELRLLRSELAEMRNQLGTQNAELQSLRQQLVSPVQTLSNVVANQANPTSRRTMLKRVGGAAAGLAALSLAAGLNPAAALADEPAIDADGRNGASGSYGGQFAGDLAQLRLVPGLAGANPGRTTGGAHLAGELYVDTDNNLYYYNGTAWNQLNTQTVYLPTPLRLVGNPNPAYSGAFPSITANTSGYFPIAGFTITNNNNGGAVTGTIPATATGVIGVLSSVIAPANGFATVYPANLSSAPEVASLSYPPGSIAVVTGSAVSVKLGPIPVAAFGQPIGTRGIAIYSQQTCRYAFDVIAYTL